PSFRGRRARPAPGGTGPALAIGFDALYGLLEFLSRLALDGTRGIQVGYVIRLPELRPVTSTRTAFDATDTHVRRPPDGSGRRWWLEEVGNGTLPWLARLGGRLV